MQLSLFSSSVLALATAAAPTFAALLAIRALEGIALAGVPAVAMTYLAEEIHPQSLGSSIGLYIGGHHRRRRRGDDGAAPVGAADRWSRSAHVRVLCRTLHRLELGRSTGTIGPSTSHRAVPARLLRRLLNRRTTRGGGVGRRRLDRRHDLGCNAARGRPPRLAAPSDHGTTEGRYPWLDRREAESLVGIQLGGGSLAGNDCSPHRSTGSVARPRR